MFPWMSFRVLSEDWKNPPDAYSFVPDSTLTPAPLYNAPVDVVELDVPHT